MTRAILTTLVLACACSACARAPEATPAPAQAAPAPATPQTGDNAASATPVAPPATVEVADAALVLPGNFAPDTTLDALRTRFGAQNVKQDEVPGAEGETSDGVILFPDDPTRRAYLYYQDAQMVTGLSTIRVFDEGSRWHLDDGIGIGMPLSELVSRNGKPIRFYGMEWDYGGTITEWNGGKLAQAKDNPVWRSIRLGTREGAAEGSYPSGDGEFSSDDRKFPKVGENLVVGEIGISFPGEDDL